MIGAALALLMAGQPAADEAALRKAVTVYASFDEEVRADAGGGELTFSTRTTLDKKKNILRFEKGFDDKVFRIAKDRGISGGALAMACRLRPTMSS